MINLTLKTACEICREMADRLQSLRKRKKISQKDLSSRAGVSYGSLKRFERTGEISLGSLCKLAIALGVEEELEGLFAETLPQSIEEVLNEQGSNRLKKNG